jgi:hypothetical protein
MAQAQTDQLLRARERAFDYQRLVDGLVFILVASSAISLFEPSPYDLLAPVALLFWALGGFTVHRAILPFALLLLAYCLLGFLALTPYWRNVDSITYQVLSTYLMMMGVFFALFLAQRSERRADVILSALTLGALIAAVCGLLGYFNVAGLGETFTLYDRAKGSFKDPNVLGPYLTPGVLNLLQRLMLGRARHIFISVAALAIILAGEFVTFSRGAWGVTLFSIALMTGCTYAQADNPRLKRRIMTTAIIAAIVGALVLLILLAQDSTREFFLQRANATQDYDEGETGRFGNQARSLPMLLDRFWGFGPWRFRLFFGLEAHDSYITAFANDGWLGGLVYVLIAASSVFVGLRLITRPSPYRSRAQIFAPVLISYFALAFVIDIDHWRHFPLLMGAVWGLEAARQKWAAKTRTGSMP